MFFLFIVSTNPLFRGSGTTVRDKGVRRWPPAGMEGILSSPGCGGGGAPAFTSVSE